MPTVGFALPPGARGGNRVTALRWARILRRLGWRAFLGEGWGGRPCDLLVCLHARHTRAAVQRLGRERPGTPVVVAGTGTDLYVDLPGGGEGGVQALEAFEAADRILLLQERALAALPVGLRERARVVHQSLRPPDRRPSPDPHSFEACVLAHLRGVKDPLLAARAARRVPRASRLSVVHLGRAVDGTMGAEARREAATNPRYRWLGPRRRRESLCHLARARLTISSSLAEGGSNAVSEALALDVPVLATAVEGTLGLLGEDHPGLFPPGDGLALAELLWRAESDPAFLRRLAEAGRARAWITDPALELEAWRALVEELVGAG